MPTSFDAGILWYRKAPETWIKNPSGANSGSGSEALTGSHVITEAHLFGAIGGGLTRVLITTYKVERRLARMASGAWLLLQFPVPAPPLFPGENPWQAGDYFPQV